MRRIHFGSKYPLSQLLALFSSSRTRPNFWQIHENSFAPGDMALLNFILCGAGQGRWEGHPEDGNIAVDLLSYVTNAIRKDQTCCIRTAAAILINPENYFKMVVKA
jgi:hypothetical protein